MIPVEAAKASQQGWKAWKPLLALLIIPAINVLYVLQNRPNSNVQSLVTDADRMLPYIPAFVLPYAIWYPFLIVVFILILRQDRHEYYRTLLALCLGLLLSNLVFLLFQTTVPRPEVTPDSLFDRLVLFIYANDRPYNCFPSVHVLTSALMIYGARVLGGGARTVVALVGATIIASTLFIKQHVLADVLAGLLAAKLVFWLAGELMPLIRKKLSAARERV
ncbi:phosphatase PAP2 family protein [Cohnella hongkongensis]|uniref:Phosphatase PAP2 family protein n=1 Tax=Cohnella hongkongensis TaxID=178337 RepID=A0ABV9F841_9BACL